MLLDIVHDEIDSVGSLENELHAHNEGVVHLQQNEFLKFQALQGLVFNDDVFPDALHGVVDLFLGKIYQVDL